ncbi:hypothetical protein VIGAN_02153600 [Vigna angularis var. angularis]|uniref:Uncharacterized protein n=1 Tax=Vigna angularis var. angularis TaxID=157739 RepID=A0A0S3RDN4_PHAAN|nr:hypothetical protein VIGAN_02153600 [Vigna angularis var. angularis]
MHKVNVRVVGEKMVESRDKMDFFYFIMELQGETVAEEAPKLYIEVLQQATSLTYICSSIFGRGKNSLKL